MEISGQIYTHTIPALDGAQGKPSHSRTSSLCCVHLLFPRETMGIIKMFTAPVRAFVRFPLVQLVIVVGIILWLQAADDNSTFGNLFNGLDRLVSSTVNFLSTIFNVKSFTKSWLTSGFWIAYVYLALLLILSLLRLTIRIAVDIVGRGNVLWMRSAIARERGIAAYRAWVPL